MRTFATVCLIVAHAITLAAADHYTFTHLAGAVGGIGYRDGKASDARFYEPTGLGVDAQGNIFVSDYGNHVIRKVTPQGDVTTLAGLARQMGFQDGRGSGARFHCPYAPAVAANGDVFLSDSDNHVIRKISTRGDVVTIAGNGSGGSENGTGTSARFDEPYGIALDPIGNVIVADSDNHTIRRVTPAGVVTTIAGSPGNAGFADGAAADARFHHPTDVAVAADGTIYVADEDNTAIRRIDMSGTVTTIAGSPGGAIFDHPLSLAVEASGILYVADFGGQTIRRIAADRTVTTLAGMAGTPGASDGRGAAARFFGPSSVRIMPSGSLIVADSFNDELRVVTPDGAVTTLAGLAAEAGYADGLGAAARFNQPDGVAAGPASIAVSDSGNHVIRAVTFDGSVSLLAGSPGSPGFADGVDGIARFNTPAQVSYGAAGELYVADFANAAIRSIAASGFVSTLAGVGAFSFPTSVVRGPQSGAVYVADRNNHVIRRIQNGLVTTFAGNVGVAGASDGPALSATFNLPHGIVSDASENLFVADYGNDTVRKISNVGIVTTIAGSAGQAGSVDGNGSAARFSFPSSVAIDNDGSLFVTDSVSNTIRRVSPSGQVTTAGGIADAPGSGDGTADHAQFNAPYAIAVTADGSLLIADRNNHAIRIGKVAAPDRAAIDATTGVVGSLRTLLVDNRGGTSFHWTLIRRPSASSAAIEDADSSTAHFTPDVADLFTFELRAEGPQGLSITTVTLTAFDKPRRRAAR